jgi:hypothetical protein
MIVSVPDDSGGVLLHDIFVAGKWVGSRRTVAQCIETLRYREWPSCVIASDYQINHGELFFGPSAARASEIEPPV